MSSEGIAAKERKERKKKNSPAPTLHHSITPRHRMKTPLDDGPPRKSKSETFGLARFPAWIAPLLLRWALLLDIALILGVFRRPVALASALLFAVFAGAMTVSFGVKAPLNLSVFSDAAAAFALAVWPANPKPK